MKKVNPRHRPVTQADVERVKKQVVQEVTQRCWVIIFTVIKDKYDGTTEDLRELWKRVSDLGESIDQGYVTVPDLLCTLQEEYGIMLNTKLTAEKAEEVMNRKLKNTNCTLQSHGNGCYSVIDHNLPTPEDIKKAVKQ